MMPDFKALIDRITENEGYRQDVYECSNGIPTVGIGFALKDLDVAPDEAYEIVKWQIENKLIRVSKEWSQKKVGKLVANRHLRWTEKLSWYVNLPPKIKGILIEMSFQMGIRGVSKFRKMLVAMEKADWEEAAKEMLDSKWAKKDSPQRANRLADIVIDHV